MIYLLSFEQGVAKFQQLINRVKPEIIIVEECGETLESSLIPCFSER